MQNPLKTLLKTNYIAQNTIILDEIDSTNNYAKNLLSENIPDGTVIIAKKQLSGKGQQTNEWQSPEGGLYYSCILKTDKHARLTIITLACGIACQEAIESISGIKTSLKWVNDIEYNNKKMGGILTESKIRGNEANLIIGIGININNKTSELSKKLQKNSTSLIDLTSENYDLEKFAAKLSNSLEKYIELYKSENFKLIKSLWLKHSKTFGQTVIIKDSEQETEGIVIDISDYGELIIQSYDGKVIKLSSNLNLSYKD